MITEWFTYPISIATLVASIYFFITFYKTESKSQSLWIIFLLTVFASMLPILEVFRVLEILETKVIAALEIGTIRLCLFWTTSLAILTYKIINRENHFSIAKAIGFFCVLSVLLGLFFTITMLLGVCGAQVILNSTNDVLTLKPSMNSPLNTAAFIITFEFVGKLIPVLLTSFYYAKVYRQVKIISAMSRGEIYISSTKILWCCIIPIIFFLPSFILDLIIISSDSYDEPIEFLDRFFVDVGFRLWILLNILTYWFLKSGSKKSRETTYSHPYLSMVASSHNNSFADEEVNDEYRKLSAN